MEKELLAPKVVSRQNFHSSIRNDNPKKATGTHQIHLPDINMQSRLRATLTARRHERIITKLEVSKGVRKV